LSTHGIAVVLEVGDLGCPVPVVQAHRDAFPITLVVAEGRRRAGGVVEGIEEPIGDVFLGVVLVIDGGTHSLAVTVTSEIEEEPLVRRRRIVAAVAQSRGLVKASLGYSRP
jgi:hypothetical protein